jgi:hypothetical protein
MDAARRLFRGDLPYHAAIDIAARTSYLLRSHRDREGLLELEIALPAPIIPGCGILPEHQQRNVVHWGFCSALD